MLNLNNRKKFEKLQFEKNKLEEKVSRLEREVFNLKSEIKNKEELIDEWKNFYRESTNEINKLKNQLKEFNPNLKPRCQKITQEDINRIKNLFKMNKTYREISAISKWSICTISKVINGYYD